MSAEEILKMSREAKDAARRLYMANESLGKYVNTAKAQQLDLSNLKKLKRTVDEAKPDLSNLKNLKRTVNNNTKKLEGIGKIIDSLKRGAFKEINPKWGAKLGLFTSVLGLGATTFLIKKNEEIQAIDIERQKITEAGLQDAYTRSLNNSIQIKTLQKQQEADKKFQNDITYEVREGRKKVESQIKTADKKANDALYEVRQGRKILEDKVELVRQKSNDALYEVRQGRRVEAME